VIDDWPHIKAPTLVFGGADDMLPGSSAVFRERMKFIADTIPNGNARLRHTSKHRSGLIRRSLRFSKEGSAAYVT
jgi:hypothetical protein